MIVGLSCRQEHPPYSLSLGVWGQVLGLESGLGLGSGLDLIPFLLDPAVAGFSETASPFSRIN